MSKKGGYGRSCSGKTSWMRLEEIVKKVIFGEIAETNRLILQHSSLRNARQLRDTGRKLSIGDPVGAVLGRMTCRCSG